MKTEYQNNLNTRDLIAIGVFAAISLAIFFVVGGIAAFTVVGTVANIPIVCFFTSIAYMLLVSRVRKPGTFLIMGLLNVLPGLMAANAVGVALSVFGWGIADLIASFGKYTGRKLVAIAYVVGCTLQSALYTLPKRREPLRRIPGSPKALNRLYRAPCTRLQERKFRGK